MACTIASLFALCVGIHAAYGLTCYECNSTDRFECGYGLTSFTYSSKECGGPNLGFSCFKVEAKSKSGKRFIARGCLHPVVSLVCESVANTIGIISRSNDEDPDALEDLKCYTCDTDKCNSAPKFTGVSLVGLLLAYIVFLI